MLNSEEMAKLQEEQKKKAVEEGTTDQEELMKMLPSFLGGNGGEKGDDSDSD